ncbi:MAG: aminotransferase class IV [Gammaproteobacteria bacterium]
MPVVYLNGAFLPVEEAFVSVMDRGFTFGDGVYEMIPVFGHNIFRLSEHLSRLGDSLAAIAVENPHSRDEWRALMIGLLNRNPTEQCQSIYLQVTRGAGVREHIYNGESVPTVFAMCKAVPDRDFSDGVSAVTHEDIRWHYCHIKSTSLLPGVMLKNHAKQVDGSFETILIRDGTITEGAASNVFIVKDKVVKTPGKDGRVLPGITRDLVIELMHSAGLPYMETTLTELELRQADEVWITSSTMGIVPVVRLDGEDVGNGRPGDVWKQTTSLYEQFKVNGVEN